MLEELKEEGFHKWELAEEDHIALVVGHTLEGLDQGEVDRADQAGPEDGSAADADYGSTLQRLQRLLPQLQRPRERRRRSQLLVVGREDLMAISIPVRQEGHLAQGQEASRRGVDLAVLVGAIRGDLGYKGQDLVVQGDAVPEDLRTGFAEAGRVQKGLDLVVLDRESLEV